MLSASPLDLLELCRHFDGLFLLQLPTISCLLLSRVVTGGNCNVRAYIPMSATAQVRNMVPTLSSGGVGRCVGAAGKQQQPRFGGDSVSGWLRTCKVSTPFSQPSLLHVVSSRSVGSPVCSTSSAAVEWLASRQPNPSGLRAQPSRSESIGYDTACHNNDKNVPYWATLQCRF
jgi:hypothetical protein